MLKDELVHMLRNRREGSPSQEDGGSRGGKVGSELHSGWEWGWGSRK